MNEKLRTEKQCSMKNMRYLLVPAGCEIGSMKKSIGKEVLEISVTR